MTYDPPDRKIEKGQLLRALETAGVKASRHALARWRAHGLFPGASRRSLGPRKGMAAFYPAIALRQAWVIAKSLEFRRNLDDAGWHLWLLKFPQPTTDWVRDLLLDELEWSHEVLRDQYERHRRCLGDTVFMRATRKRPPEAVRPMLDWGILPSRLPAVLEMFAEVQLGLAGELEKRSDEDWQLFQDGMFALLPEATAAERVCKAVGVLMPKYTAALDASALEERLRDLSPMDVRTDALEVAQRHSLPQLIEALRAAEDATLIAARDACVALCNLLAPALGCDSPVLPDRPLFVNYFADAHVRSPSLPASPAAHVTGRQN